MKWSPDNVVAVIMVVGCLCLLGFGIDGEVKAILAAAAAWVFRAGYDRIRKPGGGP